MYVYFVIFLVILAILAIIAILMKTGARIGSDVQKTLMYPLESKHFRSRTWTSEDGTPHSLISLDSGITWYSISKNKEHGIRVDGLAQEVYPGLLEKLEKQDQEEARLTKLYEELVLNSSNHCDKRKLNSRFTKKNRWRSICCC